MAIGYDTNKDGLVIPYKGIGGNMRAIKFRAWDKICKKMFYDGSLDNGDIIVLHINGKLEISDNDTYQPSDFIIEQYSGLKDKYGKEIYEGDIAIFKGMPKTEGIGNIYWSEDGACFMAKTCLPFLLHRADSIEVIGNIHENAELLENE